MKQIKNRMASILAAATIFAGITLTTGCGGFHAISPDQAHAICPQIQRIATRAASDVLASNNNETTRKALQSASLTFHEAASDTTLSFANLTDLITKLPVDQLQDEKVRLGVDAASITITLLFPDGTSVDVTKYESAQIVAECIANGIDDAMKSP